MKLFLQQESWEYNLNFTVFPLVSGRGLGVKGREGVRITATVSHVKKIN